MPTPWGELFNYADRQAHKADALLAVARYQYRGGDPVELIGWLASAFAKPATPFEVAMSEWSREHYRK